MHFFLAVQHICIFEFRKDGFWTKAAVICLGMEPEASSWKELLLVKCCVCFLFLKYRRKRRRRSQSSLARQVIGLLVKLLIHINVT